MNRPLNIKLALILLVTSIINPIFQSANATIGYDYLGSQSNTTHIWNDGSIKKDYYYTGQCLNQVSNNATERWETVYLGASYGDTPTEIINNYIEIDPDVCNRLDQSDNETYVNLTAWKDTTLHNKSVRIAKNSYIETTDDYIRETYYIKAYDEINIDTWFVIHRTRINVSGNQENDYLDLRYTDGSRILINLTAHENINLTTLINGSELLTGFFITDLETDQNIIFYHESSTEWYIYVKQREIYLIFKSGTFTPGQEKQIETYWVDAGCTCFPGPTITLQIDCTADAYGQCDDYIPGNFQMSCKVIITGGACGGCYTRYQENSGSWATIQPVNTPIDCNGATCAVYNPTSGVWYDKTIDCESTVTNRPIRCYYDHGEASPTQYTTCVEENRPPDAAIPEINSTDGSNESDQDLNCISTIHDDDGDDLNVTAFWYLNGSLNYTENYLNNYASDTEFNAILNSSNTTPGDNWSCNLRINQSITISSMNANSSINLTILENTAEEEISTTSIIKRLRKYDEIKTELSPYWLLLAIIPIAAYAYYKLS